MAGEKKVRWSTENANTLKNLLEKLYINDPPESTTLIHPLIKNHQYRAKLYKETFEPLGFTKDAFLRNFKNVVSAFQDELLKKCKTQES